MKRLRNTIFTAVLALGFFLFGNIVIAGGTPDPCDDPSSWDPCCVEGVNSENCPIDTWVYVLLAAGVGLGIKRGRDVKIKSAKS